MQGSLDINIERTIRFYAKLVDYKDLYPNESITFVIDKINKELDEFYENKEANKPDHTIKTMFEIGDHVIFSNGKEWHEGYIEDIRVHIISDKNGNYVNRCVHYSINNMIVHESWVKFYSDDWFEDED